MRADLNLGASDAMWRLRFVCRVRPAWVSYFDPRATPVDQSGRSDRSSAHQASGIKKVDQRYGMIMILNTPSV